MKGDWVVALGWAMFLSVVVMSATATMLSRQETWRAMAEKGYEQVMVVGNSSPVWQKAD